MSSSLSSRRLARIVRPFYSFPLLSIVALRHRLVLVRIVVLRHPSTIYGRSSAFAEILRRRLPRLPSRASPTKYTASINYLSVHFSHRAFALVYHSHQGRSFPRRPACRGCCLGRYSSDKWPCASPKAPGAGPATRDVLGTGVKCWLSPPDVERGVVQALLDQDSALGPPFLSWRHAGAAF